MHLGLIGKTLSHSFSRDYFNKKLHSQNISGHYDLFELATIDEFPHFLQLHQNLNGLNVTIPYKTSIIPYLDVLDETAKAVGAVNTIQIKDGTIIGYNTDCYGFEKAFIKFKNSILTPNALILGTGGAAKAVEYVLHSRGFTCQFVSRNKTGSTLQYADINQNIVNECCLIVNCSPCGMYPLENEALPLPYSLFNEKHIFIDLIYNPAKTLTAKYLELRGVKTINGLDMLYAQAEKSWEIWNS